MDIEERRKAALLQPGERFAYGLQKIGLFIPPELAKELIDAVQGVDVVLSDRDAEDFRFPECVLLGNEFKVRMPMSIAEGDREKTVEKLKEFAKEKKYYAVPGATISEIKLNYDSAQIRGTNLEHIFSTLCDDLLNKQLVKIGQKPLDYKGILSKYPPHSYMGRDVAAAHEAAVLKAQKGQAAADQPATGQQQQPGQLPGQQQQQPQQKGDGDAVEQQVGFADRYVPQQPQRQQQQQAQASNRPWAERAPANDTGKAAASTVRGGGPR